MIKKDTPQPEVPGEKDSFFYCNARVGDLAVACADEKGGILRKMLVPDDKVGFEEEVIGGTQKVMTGNLLTLEFNLILRSRIQCHIDIVQSAFIISL